MRQIIPVFRFSAMGDVAMTVPVLKTLLETYPEIEIKMISRPFFKPVFKGVPRLEFIGADVDKQYKGVTGLYKLYRELNNNGFSVVADLHDVLRTKILRNFFRFSGKKIYVIDKGRREKRELIRKPLTDAQPLKSTHQRYADVFAGMGYPVDLSKFVPLEISLSEQVNLFLDIYGDAFKIGIAPLAKHPGKQYPLGGTAEIIRQILDKTNDTVVFLFGAPGEKEILQSLVKDTERVFNLAGMFSFEQELEIISSLDLMLAPDSGNGHLAANYGVPVITMWGVTHPYAGFAPFGQPPEMQILPDVDKFPMLPCSIYGNKICPGYEKIWDTVPPEKISERVLGFIQNKK